MLLPLRIGVAIVVLRHLATFRNTFAELLEWGRSLFFSKFPCDVPIPMLLPVLRFR
jgi:hypothetical protein